jgi:DNA-binding IclR family transcriptional regulator
MRRTKKETKPNNKSLERALTILCVFNSNRQALTLGQIAQIVGFPMATTMRLCRTLVDFDFLTYDPLTKQYSLGLRLFELGGVVYSSFSLRKIVSPYLSQLQLKFSKTTFLGVLHNDELLYIDKMEDPRNQIRFASHVGMRRPPFFGMLGQLLMAYLPESEVDRILEKRPLVAFTKKSITDVAMFKRRLKYIREQGFFIDEGEAIEGVTGISAPIRDFTGRVIAAIGVGFISVSADEEERRRIVEELLKMSREISQRLGACEEKEVKNF